jgi:hypothetical protein
MPRAYPASMRVPTQNHTDTKTDNDIHPTQDNDGILRQK